MLYSEGYKMFRGTMRIVPKSCQFNPFEVRADWLYKPDTHCWYGKGFSYVEDICEIVEDETLSLDGNRHV